MKKNNGFTLIEVLIALVILSIAMIAIIKSTAQNIRDTAYLQNKAIASWVATDAINQARIGLVKLPIDSDEEHETKMLGRKWLWQGTMKDTPNQHIKKIEVRVFDSANNAQLIQLESFVYVN